MKTSRSPLLILFAFLGATPLLHAASDPRGTYKGTIQPTYINQQLLNQNPDVYFKPGDDDIDQSNIRDAMDTLKQATHAIPITLIVGGSPGQFSLDIAASGGLWWNTYEGVGNPQIAWSADGFSASRDSAPWVYHITGHYRGPAISGEWSFTINGAAVISGTFCASNTSGSGGCSAPQNTPAPANANGEYKGTISSSDANAASGHIQFTVSGNSVHGTASGQWMQAQNPDSEFPEADKEAGSGTYSGTFSGTVDPGSGSFTANLSGKIGDFDFTGHVRGTIQGNDASGTWDAASEYAKGTGTWRASRPAPVIPILDTSGVGGEVVDSQPPGISGVGDVPGPENLPETGTGLLLPGLLAAAGIGLKSMLDASVTPPPTVDYGPVAPPADTSGFDESMTDSLVDSTPAPAAQPAAPAPSVDPQYAQALQDAQDATDKYTAMQKQLADFEQGADPTDPQYAVLKKQYTDYIDYYKQKADAIAKAIEQDQNTVVLKDFKGDPVKQVIFDPATGLWHDSETGNLFDPSKWGQVQDQAAQDFAWSQADLQHMIDRQDAFSQQMDEVVRAEDQKEAALKYLEKMNKTAWDTGMADFTQAHNPIEATEKMMDDILAGKPINVPEILAGRRYMEDRLLGISAQESTLSLPENQANLLDYTKTAAWNSLQELVTGRDTDGHFTVAGFLGMVSLHIGGAMVAGPYYEWLSEGLLTGASTVYAEKDAIDHGATDLDALEAGAWEMVKTGGIQAAAGLGMHYFPNVAKGIGEMVQPTLSALGQKITALAQRINRVPYQLRTQLFLCDELKLTRAALDKALDSGDPADLIKLYQNGGMDRLGELQAAGGMSAADAKLLNSRLMPMVSDVVDHSTRKSMLEFFNDTKVPVKQTIIADSGSSARGVSSKAFTDADRTVITQFDQKDVADWIEAEVKAGNPRLNMEQANEKLRQMFADKLADNVDRNLRAVGFEGGAKDVHYSTYNGIGPSAGQPDCYGAGWTGQRMKLQGVATEYSGGGFGTVQNTRTITGTAAVDQHGLNVAEVTGKLPPNPDKFSPDEFDLFSRQQVDAASGHLDVKSVAKAMKRESDLSDRINSMSGNSYGRQQLQKAGIPTNQPVLDKDLTDIAKEICNRPSEATAILADNNMTQIVFQARVRDALRSYHAAIGGT
jgi:hypothetical protein